MKKDKLKILAVNGQKVLAERDDGIDPPYLADLTVIEDGKPIPPDAEVIHFQHDGGVDETMCDVTVLKEGRKGPARASNRKYRSNYDKVFGKSSSRTLN